MPVPRRVASVVVRATIGALLFAWIGAANATTEDVVVITNVPHGQLPHSTVRAMFAMRVRQWPDDGSRVTVFVLRASDPLHALFCKRILDVFPYQIQRAWDRLVFSGTGQAPVELDSMEEMQRMVAVTPGAIGYVTSDRVNKRVHSLRLQ